MARSSRTIEGEWRSVPTGTKTGVAKRIAPNRCARDTGLINAICAWAHTRGSAAPRRSEASRGGVRWRQPDNPNDHHKVAHHRLTTPESAEGEGADHRSDETRSFKSLRNQRSHQNRNLRSEGKRRGPHQSPHPLAQPRRSREGRRPRVRGRIHRISQGRSTVAGMWKS